MNDPEPDCRCNAVALAAGLYLDKTTEQRLTSIALHDRESRVRALAIEFLPDVTCEYFKGGEKNVKRLLETAVNNDDSEVALKAKEALQGYEEIEKYFLSESKKGVKLPRNSFEAKLKTLILKRGVGIADVQNDLLATADIGDLPLLYEIRENILQRISDEGFLDYQSLSAIIVIVKLRSYAQE